MKAILENKLKSEITSLYVAIRITLQESIYMLDPAARTLAGLVL